MAKTATVTKVQPKAPAPKSGGTTGATLMQQYENAINRGVGQGTEGNPIGDFKEGSDAFWDQSSNLRGYADRLRSQQRGHEKSMLGMELSGQQATARIQSQGDNYGARLGLEGTKYQTDGRVKEAQIGARAQQGVARTQAGTERYSADLQYKSSLASNQTSKEIAAGEQAGQNYRSGLDLAGRLLTNQADNYTARQGQFFDYMGRKAQSQHQGPTTANIKYWAG